MTVKEVVHNIISDNWDDYFKCCISKNCDEIPHRAVKSASNFFAEFTKYSDEEQLSLISKLVSDEDLRTCLHETQKKTVEACQYK